MPSTRLSLRCRGLTSMSAQLPLVPVDPTVSAQLSHLLLLPGSSDRKLGRPLVLSVGQTVLKRERINGVSIRCAPSPPSQLELDNKRPYSSEPRSFATLPIRS